jgi:hypothetical protein
VSDIVLAKQRGTAMHHLFAGQANLQHAYLPHSLSQALAQTTTMNTTNRSYIDPQTAEVLLFNHSDELNGWFPAVTDMDDILAGTTRLYRTADTDEFVTISEEGAMRLWPQLSITEEPDIRALIAHPWITDGSYVEGLTVADVSAAETLYRGLSTYSDMSFTEFTIPTDVEAALRPLLDWPALDPTPIAIPVAHVTYFTTGDTAAPPPPLPKHVAALVIDKAIADEAPCPITMETITKGKATVTSCGHVFQTQAIRTWLNARDTCPECRQICCIDNGTPDSI